MGNIFLLAFRKKTVCNFFLIKSNKSSILHKKCQAGVVENTYKSKLYYYVMPDKSCGIMFAV